MAGIARVGDILGKGGLLTYPASTNGFVNGRPVALMGCIYTAHPPCSPKLPQHCWGPTFAIPAGVTVNGMIPITGGSKGLCGESVFTSSLDVSINTGLLGMAANFAAGKVLA